MATVIINNQEIEIPGGRRLNAIEAARLIGVKIPHYCWHPALSVVGSCRMCLIEVGTRNPQTGEVTMQDRLVPACNTIVTDGMVLVTDSERVARARAMVEEDLLLRHPIDCPICDKAGECKLQDYHFKYGQSQRRAEWRPFTSRRRDLGDVALFVDRCVLCSRCVRFTNEISGTGELMIVGRGTQEEIDVLPQQPLHNKLSGNVVDLCPVGALADKDFLYRQRVWFLRRHPGVCTGCATGCSIWIEENQETVHRIKPRNNLAVNKWWICNDGRYDYPHIHDPRRLTRLLCTNKSLQGNSQATNRLEITWDQFIDSLRNELKRAERLSAVVSPHQTVEEAYLLCKFIKAIDPDAILALGPVSVEGSDDRFPGGFMISAEKCPNRRGVEAVLAHFSHRLITFDEFLQELSRGAIRGCWVAGGYKENWIDLPTARRFEQLELLIVQDLFPSPLSDRAGYVLPGVAFAERAGSYVNRADRLQSVPRAIRPPFAARSEGDLFWELLGYRDCYDATEVLQDIAREIPYFSNAVGEIPETGVDLRGNLLA